MQRAATERNRSVRRRDVTCVQYDAHVGFETQRSLIEKKHRYEFRSRIGGGGILLLLRVIQLKYIDIGGDSTRVAVYRVRETPVAHDKRDLNRPHRHFSLFSNTLRVTAVRVSFGREIDISLLGKIDMN